MDDSQPMVWTVCGQLPLLVDLLTRNPEGEIVGILSRKTVAQMRREYDEPLHEGTFAEFGKIR